MEQCKSCNGSGEIESKLYVGQEGMQIEKDVPVICDECNGRGRVRITPTHFMEVWKKGNNPVCKSESVFPIGELKSILYNTQTFPMLKTIAVWLIAPKLCVTNP